ncbi:TetR/AcrR family transcriptional regulator [uncultured Roseobacter sp.]|uniref:TetR/AcrR family transcriptional regulator n=1 Tax=uncultured Roseobacter sp. TaxID=114847 RepID=UPI00260BB61D|nr:TetR/AcrR family transcriptional regulator [uncultured Roseobacter sp.]
MPWEKDFDTEVALGDAMRVFWAKGYEATSITDLTKAMRINKGSLYNAYGGKKDLFIKAILKYTRDNQQATLAKLAHMQDPLDAIKMLFEAIVTESLADDDKRGCFLVNTALDMPNHTKDIQEIVSGSLHNMENFLERCIVDGQARGSISAHLNSRETAKSLLAQIVGLRVLARGVFTHDGLNTIKKQAVLGLVA